MVGFATHLKKEATDSIDNKGSSLPEIRNEATGGGRWQSALSKNRNERQKAKGKTEEQDAPRENPMTEG